jgi:hypothetical protein
VLVGSQHGRPGTLFTLVALGGVQQGEQLAHRDMEAPQVRAHAPLCILVVRAPARDAVQRRVDGAPEKPNAGANLDAPKAPETGRDP